MRVPITAVSVRTSLAADVGLLRAALMDGRSAVTEIEGFDAPPGARAAQIWKEGDAAEDDPALRILGPHGRLLERVAHEAHAGAGLVALVRERVGLHVATGMVDSAASDLEPAVRASLGPDGQLDLGRFFAGGYRSIHPLWPLSMLGNVAVGQIATDLDIRGDNLVLASDAAAGVRALVEGAEAVSSGLVDATLSGGVAERVSPASLARRTLAGQTLAPGEGAAVIAFGGPAVPLGWFLGGATTFDADPEAAARSARARTLDRARLGRDDVDEELVVSGADSPFVSSVGDLGPAGAAVGVALSCGWAGKRILVTTVSADGSAGAVLVEAA